VGIAALEGDALTMHRCFWAAAVLLTGILALPQFVRGDDVAAAPQQNAENPIKADQTQAPADVILVVGAAGEESFGEAFTLWAKRWDEVARAAGATVSLIGPVAFEPEQDLQDLNAGDTDTAGEPTDRDRLRTAIADLDDTLAAPVWIVMMGHGTFSQSIAKFNLRGPDVSAGELAQWVEPLSRPLVVINAFSSSGPFINALSAENRVIVTATRSGTEQNYSRFGDYLSRSIGDASADIDHDGEVSILEAFLAASAGVRDFYQSSGRIATEHALIDDNGDALGTPATAFRAVRVIAKPSNPEQTTDGALAGQIALSPVAARVSLTQLQRIERDEIEAELARLRSRRETMAKEEYREAILPHLIRLARLYEAAGALRSERPSDSP
jgi:hypothetical protein